MSSTAAARAASAPADDGAREPTFGSAIALGNSYVLSLGQAAGASGLFGGGGADGGGARAAAAGGGGGGGGAGGGGGRGPGGGGRAGPAAGIQDVRDAVLLHGYQEPVLLVLHQQELAWAGRYRCA